MVAIDGNNNKDRALVAAGVAAEVVVEINGSKDDSRVLVVAVVVAVRALVMKEKIRSLVTAAVVPVVAVVIDGSNDFGRAWAAAVVAFCCSRFQKQGDGRTRNSKGMDGRGQKKKKKRMSSSCWKAGIPARQFKACLKKL